MSQVDRSKPAALLVTRNFPPLIGGMEKLNFNIYLALKEAYQTVVCGPLGSAAFIEKGAAAQAPIRPLPVFLLRTLFRSIGLARAVRPEFILGGSGLVAPIVWCAARLTGARMVLYLHGLDIVVPNVLYQRAWLPFIRRADQILVNSVNTKSLAISQGIASERIEILHPGTELPLLGQGRRTKFRADHRLGDAKLLLSVGRFTRRKGLAEFVRHSFPKVVEDHSQTKLVIIGDEAADALTSGGSGSERQRIIEAASAAGIEEHVLFLGHCDEEELSAAYEAADCHIFPVMPVAGDVEGFGMVALESAAHGLPTVAFAIGGVPDAVAPEPAGYLVESGDYAALARRVSAVLARREDPAVCQECLNFARRMSWGHFADRLRALMSH